MTGTQVALLRGINVGRAKRVAMADLRALVASLGYAGVETLLNSGNVIFSDHAADPATAARRIEEAVGAGLGVRARVIVLSAAELATIVAENPMRDTVHDPSHLLVTVPGSPADLARLVELTRRDWAPEALALGSRAVYQWCPGGILAGRLAAAVGRALGDAATARNWATVVRLHALAASRE